MQLKLYQQLLVKRYIKSFLTIFLALNTFFVGIDIIGGLDSLPQSASLKILYAINTFLYFSSFVFVLSLVFALISSVTSLIKENELVAIYSFGFSKKEILKPFLYSVLGLILFFITINNFSFFVNAKQVADNIKHYQRATKYEANLFLKYKDSYIFISELNKFKKEGKEIEIFDIKDNRLTTLTKAKVGIFRDNLWILKDVSITKLPDIKESIENKKLKTFQKSEVRALQGFKPSIMDSLYHSNIGLSISDSIKAIFLLKDKDINISAIKSNLYKAVFYPFFALFFAIFIFIQLPLQRRGENLNLITTKLYFITLISWGVFFILIKISKSGSLPPEIGIILPILLLGLFALYIYKKKLDKF